MTHGFRFALIATCVGGTLSLAFGGATLRAAGRAPDAVATGRTPADSDRLVRAKDLMSDDQWAAAIPLLRAAVADPAEAQKDEALFWLAHSQNQAGDLAESVESIRRLQREHPASRWSRPAFSLLIELAQKLGRNDVLWRTAAPPPPPPPPQPPVPPSAAPPRGVAMPPHPPPPPTAWLPDVYRPDADLRIQALGRLMRTDADKVIPLLRSIALESDTPAVARRALFVLAQSRNPDAEMTVVDIAKAGPEDVRLAAVRELGRFGGPNISQQLLQVYPTGTVLVKEQVVASLAERADAVALLRIAQSEQNDHLRDTALIALGRAGGREHLRALYDARVEARRAIIIGLFNARDEDGLIRIADRETNQVLRADVLSRLRLMGTPKAQMYLEKVK